MKLLPVAAVLLNLLAAVTSAESFKPPASFKNVNLVHVISLEKNYAKESINVQIENIASSPQDEYFLPFTADQAARVGGIEVKDRKDATLEPFDVQLGGVDGATYVYLSVLMTNGPGELTRCRGLPAARTTTRSSSPRR